MSVCVQYEHLHIIVSSFFICLCIGLGVWQCEHIVNIFFAEYTLSVRYRVDMQLIKRRTLVT